MSRSSRSFQRAAMQRLTTADFLLRHSYCLDAMYLGGYSIECSLKALILRVTPVGDQTAMLKTISAGKKMHSFDVLAGKLRALGPMIPPLLAKRLSRSTWSTALRYETGQTDTGETRAFLKTAKLIFDWVQGEMK